MRWIDCAVGAKIYQRESALFDFNHPLAGQALAFEVKIIGIL